MQKLTELSQLGLNANGRVLCVMPHPDDEAYFVSGLLQRLKKVGIPTRLITLTRGEASSHRYGLTDDEDLAAVRTLELENAMNAIGLKDHKICNIPDGALEKHEKDVMKILKEESAAFQPSVMVLLEPDGIYGHPDHIALTKFSRVVAQEKLIHVMYATVSASWKASAGAAAMAQKKIQPMPATHFYRLSLPEMIAKFKCIQAHGSQFQLNPPSLTYLWKMFRRGSLRTEYFAIEK